MNVAVPGPAHFIPFRRREILAMCLSDGALSPSDAEAFRPCAALVSALIHHDGRLEALKDAYAPVAADEDTRWLTVLPPEMVKPPDLVATLRTVLERANFSQVDRAELHKALEEESLFKVRLHVDYRDFEELLVFKRGETMRTEFMPTWFGLKRRKVRFVNYDRVLIYVRFKKESHFKPRRRRKLPFKPGTVFIKLFQNIPKADIEMLFPNATVRMKAVDKLIIGIPALVGGAIVAVTKLGATVVLITVLVAFWLGLRNDEVRFDQAALFGLGAGLFAFGGFLWRQFNAFRNRKIQFLKILADNLYFKKLDTNAGVFHRLIDAAEEEECKEVLLAYYFLVKAECPLDGPALDRAIEAWFREKWGSVLDFDLDDALRKITRLGLADFGATTYRAVPLAEARRRLDHTWDALFNGGPGPGAAPAGQSVTAAAA